MKSMYITNAPKNFEHMYIFSNPYLFICCILRGKNEIVMAQIFARNLPNMHTRKYAHTHEVNISFLPSFTPHPPPVFSCVECSRNTIFLRSTWTHPTYNYYHCKTKKWKKTHFLEHHLDTRCRLSLGCKTNMQTDKNKEDIKHRHAQSCRRKE